MNEDSRLLRGIKQRKKRFITVLKIALVFYLLIFSVKYVTSSTSAYFIDSNVATGKFTAGTWEKSKLKYIGNGLNYGNDNLKVCTADMEVIIKNISENDMFSPSKYEIYYTNEQGNPKNHGDKIAEGVIPMLKSNEELKLNYETSNEGFYMFKAYQTNKTVDDVWSEKIKVKCKSNNDQTTNEQKEQPKKEIEIENIETPETKPSEEPGLDEVVNQPPENNEPASTKESKENTENTDSNTSNQSEDTVNISVPDQTTNVEGNKEIDGQ